MLLKSAVLIMKSLLNASFLQVGLARVVPAVAGIGFVGIAVNRFAPAAYGQFSLAFTAANLLAVLSVGWVAQSILRFASGDGGMRLAFKHIALFAFFWSVSVASVIYCVCHLINWPALFVEFRLPPLLFIGLVSSLALQIVVSAAVTSSQQFSVLRNVEFVRSGGLLGLTVVAAYLLHDSAGLTLAYGLSILMPYLFLIFYFHKRLLNSNACEAPKLLELLPKFLYYGWPIALWAGMQAGMAFFERNILSEHMAATEFGYFISVADLMTRGIGLVLMPLVTVLHPRIMAEAGNRMRIGVEGIRLVRHGVVLAIVASVVLMGILILLKDSIAKLIPGFGQVDRLTVLMFGLAATLWIIALLIHKPLEVRGAMLRMSMCLVFSILVQMALLKPLIQYTGPIGMPLTSVCSALTYVIGCLLVEHFSAHNS